MILNRPDVIRLARTDSAMTETAITSILLQFVNILSAVEVAYGVFLISPEIDWVFSLCVDLLVAID